MSSNGSTCSADPASHAAWFLCSYSAAGLWFPKISSLVFAAGQPGELTFLTFEHLQRALPIYFFQWTLNKDMLVRVTRATLARANL